jgi:hypothetical protein
MFVVVDRIEGQIAVIEFPDRTTKDVPLDELPNDLIPGDSLLYCDGVYTPAPEESAKRRERINKLMESMWKD